MVLTPGIYNSAYFEHTLLASEMGVELVEGRDLICSNNRVYVRTTAGDMPVHVIYRRHRRRVPRPDAVPAELVARLARSAERGAGRQPDHRQRGRQRHRGRQAGLHLRPGHHPVLPETRSPILLNVDTYRMEEPDHRDYALEHLDELVFKPVDGSGGKGIVIGSQADSTARAKVRQAILDNPRDWIAQLEIALSTSPTLIGDKMRPRHVDLRPFAINDGESVWVLPGGLTRVALPEGALVVNSSQGGGSKDTWVLRDTSPQAAPAPAPTVSLVIDETMLVLGPATEPDTPAAYREQQGQQQQVHQQQHGRQRQGEQQGQQPLGEQPQDEHAQQATPRAPSKAGPPC